MAWFLQQGNRQRSRKMVEKLSDWFEGELYTEGAEVPNRFTGKKITLN